MVLDPKTVKLELDLLVSKWEVNKSKCKYPSFVDEVISTAYKLLRKKNRHLGEELNLLTKFNLLKIITEKPHLVNLNTIFLEASSGDKI